ncbi:MAG: NUDIX hydrolase [Acidimicrobiales bacterium]
MGSNDSDVVRAAGGIVVRAAKKGPKVLLVHRPRYDDWSFPKGKVDPGETFKEAALREVLEETGFECKRHRPRLPSMTYMERSGRLKEVRYWLMTVKKGAFTPNNEVDLIAWVRTDKVADRLTYSRDRELFEGVRASRRIDDLLGLKVG